MSTYSESERAAKKEAQRAAEVGRIAVILIVVLTAATLGAVMVGAGGYLGVVGVAVLVGTAATVVGAVLGFIFAIPRAKERAEQVAEAVEAAEAARTDNATGPKESREYLRTNSNLVRISDWLTTMLVGVGLTQINQLYLTLKMFGLYLQESYAHCSNKNACNVDVLGVLGPGVLVLGAVAGFLFMYLYTRLVLVELLNNIEGILRDLDQPLNDASNARILAATGAKINQGVDGSDTLAESSPVRESGATFNVGAALQLMFAALYKDPPASFQEALKIGGALNNTAAERQAIYWFYLAAAFGQKHAYISEQKDLTDEARADGLLSARNNAIDAVRRALETDTSGVMKTRLRALTTSGGDDDLLTLAEDTSLNQLLS